MTPRLAFAPIAALLLAGCGTLGPRPIAEDATRTEGPRRFALTKCSEMTPEQRANGRRSTTMTVNVDRTPIPNDAAKPLPKLR